MPVFEETVIQVQTYGQEFSGSKVVTIEVITPFYTSHKCDVYTQAINPIYGTLTGAENYFKSKLSSARRSWDDADYDDRIAALRQATQIIERLNLKGTPSSDYLHFPTEEHGMPYGIDHACYEIALRLLDGIDPDTEADNLSVLKQGYATGHTYYDRSFVQDHLRAGVPSATAWIILRPYLCDPKSIRTSRGS